MLKAEDDRSLAGGRAEKSSGTGGARVGPSERGTGYIASTTGVLSSIIPGGNKYRAIVSDNGGRLSPKVSPEHVAFYLVFKYLRPSLFSGKCYRNSRFDG